eukprot:510120-Karenia_brevis.AAC.2
MKGGRPPLYYYSYYFVLELPQPAYQGISFVLLRLALQIVRETASKSALDAWPNAALQLQTS